MGVGSPQGWKRRLREVREPQKSERFGCLYHSFFFSFDDSFRPIIGGAVVFILSNLIVYL